MQTKEQCLEKVAEMAAQIAGHVQERAGKLLKSGAIDLGEYEDNYVLPKILLTACLEYETDQWRPLHPAHKRAALNLSYF